MGNFNKVILMGNLTRDPELRYTPQGTAVTDLNMAINSVRGGGRGSNAERKEETLFIDVTVWDRMAENCCEYLGKGRSVMVEGRLVQDTWEDRESGAKRSKIKAVASNVQFIGGRGEGGGGGSRGGSQGGGNQGGESQGGAPRQQQRQAPKQNNDFGGDDFGNGDDIPF